VISLREKDRRLSNSRGRGREGYISSVANIANIEYIGDWVVSIRREWPRRDFRFVGASTPSRLFGIDPTVGAIRAGGCLSSDAVSKRSLHRFLNSHDVVRRCATSAIPSIAISVRLETVWIIATTLLHARFHRDNRYQDTSLSLGKYHILLEGHR